MRILFALCLGVFALGVTYGLPILNPTYVNWLLSGDSAYHYIGWTYFRHEAWTFPIGKIETFLVPIGASLIQMDSIPLFAVFFKALRQFLPEAFQYFGLWHLLCYSLQAYWGMRIGEVLGFNRLQSFLIGLILTLAPPLVYRADHHSLCAQFAILVGIWSYISVALEKKKPHYIHYLWVSLFLAAVHPYLVAMTFPVFLACYYRAVNDEPSKLKIYVVQTASIIFLVTMFCWTLAYFEIKDIADVGFGGYSSDLLTFINSMNTSRFLPALRRGWGQYEGFAYLGLGILLSLMINLPWYFKRKIEFQNTRKRMRALFWIALILFIYAMGTPLTFGGNGIISLSWFYDRLGSLPGAFRATGRFSWVAYYCLFTFSFWLISKRFKPQQFTLVLAVVAFVQIADIWPWIRGTRATPKPSKVKIEGWRKFGDNRSLILVPVRMSKGSYDCNRETFDLDQIRDLAIVGGSLGWAINSGSAGRLGADVYEVCEKFWENLPKKLSKDQLYVVHPSVRDKFKKTFNDKLNCQPVNGFEVCETSM